jgi:dihydrodipicolinate synthase/N-acetylneuraminate lyase
MDHWVTHLKTLSFKGIRRFVLFGKCGEGECFSGDTKVAVLKALLAEGWSPEQLVLGIQGSASQDVVRQLQSAYALGLRQFLITPPAHQHPVQANGLVSYFQGLVKGVGQAGWCFYLHLWGSPGPLEITDACIQDIALACTPHFAGLVDEGPSLARTLDYQKSMAGKHVVIPTCESNVIHLKPRQLISGVANLAPRLVAALLDPPPPPPANKDIAGLKAHVPDERFQALMSCINDLPRIAALKYLMHLLTHGSHWLNLQPPHAPIAVSSEAELQKRFKQFHIQPNE